MATTIRDLLVKLGIDANDRAAINFDRAVQGVRKTMLASVAAAGALSAGLFEIARRTAAAGDEAAKAAARMGTTAEAAQELAYAADQGGAAFSDMERGVRRTARVVQAAAEGNESARKTIARLGVTTHDANGQIRDGVDLFEDFVSALQGVESSVERAALANDLFGRSGGAFLAFAAEGEGSIKAYREEARLLGFVISDEAAAASELFNDSMLRLRMVLIGVRNQIGIGLIPIFTRVIIRTWEWLASIRGLIGAHIDRVFERINAAVEKIVAQAKDFDELIRGTIGWDTVLTSILSVLTTISAIKIAPALIVAVKGIIAIFSVAGIKFIAIGALIAGVVLVIQDLITYFRGGESVIGGLIERLKSGEGRLGAFGAKVQEIARAVATRLQPTIERLQAVFKEAGRVFVAVGKLIWLAAKALFARLQEGLAVWWRYAEPVWRFLADVAQEALNEILDFFGFVFGAIGDVLEFFVSLFSGDFETLEEITDAALEVVKSIFERAFDFIAGQIERRIELVRGIFQNMVNWISEQIDRIMGRFDGAISAAKRIPGLGRLLGGGGAAHDVAVGQRQAGLSNMALAMNSGDTALEINIGGTNASPQQIAGAVGDQLRALFDQRLRQAAATFGGGEL